MMIFVGFGFTYTIDRELFAVKIFSSLAIATKI